MKTLRTAFIACTFLFAMGAFAWQYPGASQSTQPSQGTMQPSQPSQTQPSQNPGAIQPGQQQQPGAATQSQSAQANGRPSIDDQVQSLTQQLNLTADQQAKVKTALEDQHTQAMNVVQDSAMPREDKIQKIHAIREGTINKVRTALNDDQKKKFDAMVQQQDQRMHEQQQPQPQTPPQPK